jgi:serine/threonine protein kinase
VVDRSLLNLKSVQKIHGAEFIVDVKYRIIAPIGKGSYGMVWYASFSFIRSSPLMLTSSAINQETGQKVAIKKIENTFVNHKDTKRTLREIKLLRYFDHDNVCFRWVILSDPIDIKSDRCLGAN